MCGALWIDIGEFPQTVRRVARWDQAAFEVFQRFPAASVYLYSVMLTPCTRNALGEVDGLAQVARVSRVARGSEWLPSVYPLAVDRRGDQGVHSGRRAGQATILAPSPNLAVSPTPMAS